MIWYYENWIFISYKKKKQSAKWIIKNLPKYIYFYNNFKSQAKLKGMNPVQYRKSFP
ncbi:IS3 family transposase [Spiroplasma chrysopicola]|uniref:IS3 family transposase n=1 Tax=Spiroplasma chrysopicola TaxID=216933 RepID=UPI001F00EF65